MKPTEIKPGLIYRGGSSGRETRKVLRVIGGKRVIFRDASPRRQQADAADFAQWAVMAEPRPPRTALVPRPTIQNRSRP
jgi:hypothetical protein